MYKRQIIFLWFIVFSIISVSWLWVISNSEVKKSDIVQETYKNLSNLSRSYKDSVQTILQEADNILLFTKEHYEVTGQIRNDTQEIINSMKNVSKCKTIDIINKDGIVEASTDHEAINTSSAGREYFIYHQQDNSRNLHFDRPILDKITGKWSFALSRRINNPNGSFAGVVVAVVDSSYFTDFYSKMELDDTMFIVMIGTEDAIIRGRQAEDDSSLGQYVPTAPVFKYMKDQPKGTFNDMGAVAHRKRFMAYEVMSDFPLVVVVGIDEEAALNQYNIEFLHNIKLLSLYTFILILITGILSWVAFKNYKVSLLIHEKTQQLENEIAEKNMIESNLSNHNQLLSTLINSLTVGVYMIEVASGKVLLSNERAKQILRCTTLDNFIDLKNKTLNNIIQNGTNQPYPTEKMPLYLGMNGESSHIEDMVFVLPDGERILLEVSGTPVKDTNSDIVASLVSFADITERKRLEEEIRTQRDAAQEANTAKSQFLANMSHEIRTPMNGILGIAQLLVMDLQDEQKDMASMIKTSGDNLLNIINDILDLSKIEAGKVRLSHEDFEINNLVDEVDNIIKLLVVRKGLEYKSHIGEEINGHLIGDPGRLKQILINLLGNAIKFTELGRIELSIDKGKVYEDRVQLIFSIIDTGIGIAKDKIGQLFTYFTQGDDSVTKKYGGTGLGLAISKQLINMMDGEISVESQIGIGSKFSFNAIFMQTTEEKAFKTASDGDAPTVKINYSRALLVEDDYVSGLVMKKLCERKNINLKIATSGKQAMDILKDEKFDIIFMDIQMPDISGFETAAIIRDREKILNKHTPIIATTAFALVGDREKSIVAGMDDYLAKPIDAEKFYAMVEKYVSEK